MISWLKKLLDSLPIRCLAIIYMDMNSEVGVEHLESRFDSEWIGQHNLAKGNTHLLSISHGFLENWKMFLPMTSKPLEPTFLSIANSICSSIDHIVVIGSLCSDSLDCNIDVWTRSGRRLPLIRSIHLADDTPSCFICERSIYRIQPWTRPPSLDRDAMMRCIRCGYRRNEFVERLEAIELES